MKDKTGVQWFLNFLSCGPLQHIPGGPGARESGWVGGQGGGGGAVRT